MPDQRHTHDAERPTGWRNWQTWAVYTHLTDDETVHRRSRAIVERELVALEAASHVPDGLGDIDAVSAAAEELQRWLEAELVDPLDNDDWRTMFQADLLHVALEAVDWVQLAEVLVESAESVAV